jgi:hypothetical protein
MRVPYSKMGWLILACFSLGFMLAIAYIFLPLIVGQPNGNGNSFIYTIMAFMAMASMILIILAGFFTGLVPLLAIIEVGTSKNEISFKLIWGIVLFVLGIFGFAAYYFIGRKELK